MHIICVMPHIQYGNINTIFHIYLHLKLFMLHGYFSHPHAGHFLSKGGGGRGGVGGKTLSQTHQLSTPPPHRWCQSLKVGMSLRSRISLPLWFAHCGSIPALNLAAVNCWFVNTVSMFKKVIYNPIK